MATGIWAWICIILFILVVMSPLFVFLIATKKRKAIYQVTYKRFGFSTAFLTVFIEAKDYIDIQKQLEKREFPFDIQIVSLKEM